MNAVGLATGAARAVPGAVALNRKQQPSGAGTRAVHVMHGRAAAMGAGAHAEVARTLPAAAMEAESHVAVACTARYLLNDTSQGAVVLVKFSEDPAGRRTDYRTILWQ